MENIVMNALLRHAGNYFEATDVVTAAIKSFWMKAPGLAAADSALKNIDRQIILRRAHRKAQGSSTKIKHGRHDSPSAGSIGEGLFAVSIEEPSSRGSL